MIVSGDMSATNALSRMLLAYQPGGLAERQKLLQGLTDPGVAGTAVEASEKLRKWQRWLVRSQGLGVATPDASLLLAGVDKMVATLLTQHAQLNLRVSLVRIQLQLDFSPDLSGVLQFVKNLQAEFDTLALSTPVSKAKAPKVNQVLRPDETKGKGKGKQGNQGEASVATQPGQPNPKTVALREQFELCKFYGAQNGCNKGRKCKDWHEFAEAKREGRCVNCGSKKHAEAECTRPTTKGKGKGKEKENAQNPKGKGKEQGSQSQSSHRWSLCGF